MFYQSTAVSIYMSTYIKKIVNNFVNFFPISSTIMLKSLLFAVHIFELAKCYITLVF